MTEPEIDWNQRLEEVISELDGWGLQRSIQDFDLEFPTDDSMPGPVYWVAAQMKYLENVYKNVLEEEEYFWWLVSNWEKSRDVEPE